MKTSMKSLLACSTSVVCLAFGANAQSVDYSELQQTFGEPVTMSATGKPQRASDVPADMTILTQDQIRRSGATRLSDILKFVPGMDVRDYGNASSEVSVHGYIQPSTPRLLVLVNGRQVYLEDYGYVSWNTIPVQLTEIQQIEFVKGPGSSLFGFNAVAGVINIITVDPQKTETAVFQVTGGSYSTTNYSAVIAHHITPDLAFKVSGGLNRQQAYGINPAVGTPIAPMSYNATADVRWQALDKLTVRSEGTWIKARQFELIAPSGFANMDYMTYSYKLGAAADTEYGLIDISAYRNHMTDYVKMSAMSLKIANDISVISANDIFQIGSSVTVRVAGEYRNSINMMGATGGRVGTEDIASSAMVDWAITDALSWTNSARIDFFSPRINTSHFDHNSQPLSYNSGLVWKATADDTVRLLAGRSVQTPSMILMNTNGPNFEPSTLDNLELSWDRALAGISSKLHVAVYQEWYSNLMGFAATNVGSSKSTGMDASLEGAAQGWRWNLSLNARSISDDIVMPTGGMIDPYPVDFVQTTPKYVGTFGVGKTLGDFEFDLMGKWQSQFKDWTPISQLGRPGGPGGPGGGTPAAKFMNVPSYLTMTARIGWKISDNFTLAVTAAQFNKKNVYEGAGVPDKTRYLVSLTAGL